MKIEDKERFWKRVYERWDINYFNGIYEKMLNRIDVYGNHVYSPKAAFNILNEKYRRTLGKYRYKNFNSFKQIRNRKLRG